MGLCTDAVFHPSLIVLTCQPTTVVKREEPVEDHVNEGRPLHHRSHQRSNLYPKVLERAVEIVRPMFYVSLDSVRSDQLVLHSPIKCK